MSEHVGTDWISREEYLALERLAEFRSEYRDGRIRRMPPSNLTHNRLVVNLMVNIWEDFKDRPYSVLAINMRTLVLETGLFAYPDLVIIDDDCQFLDREQETLLDPIFIIEVVSPASESWDRDVKFIDYRRLASLSDYALVSQNSVHVEHYSRQGDRWDLAVLDRLDDSLRLSPVGCEVSLSKIYREVFPLLNPIPLGW